MNPPTDCLLLDAEVSVDSAKLLPDTSLNPKSLSPKRSQRTMRRLKRKSQKNTRTENPKTRLSPIQIRMRPSLSSLTPIYVLLEARSQT